MYRDQIQFPVSPFLVLYSRFQKISSFKRVINGDRDFFKNRTIELIQELNVEQTGVLHLLRHCFCLLLNSAQKVEEYTGSFMRRCFLQTRSPSGREQPSVAGITDGVWLSCGMPEPPLLHQTSGGEKE